ncbi:MAG: IS1182 family transposase [Alphaproteobacteria bacterium]|nr:IS1182 family transposase [Alphaproteobacteria bacterium]
MTHIAGFERDQLLLLPEAVDDYVDAENPVRFIDAFVDGLDLAAAGFARVTARATGRPGYAPGDLLKLYIYGYLNRVRSSRRLEREAHRNIEVIWLLRSLRPDFKTIADFRRDNRAAFRAVFRQFVLLCRRLDLYGRELLAVDGTRIKAVNNKDRNFTRTSLREFIRAADERLNDYLARLDASDIEDGASAGGARTKNLAEKIEALRKKRGRYEAMLAQLDRTGEDQISLTDPDSRAMAAHTKVGVGYNVQVAVDAKNKMIVEQAVTNQVVDMGLLTQTAEPAREILGIETIDVVADRGYFKVEDIDACEKAGCIPHVPKPQRGSSVREGFFRKDEFRYDAGRDAYVCPAGQLLTPIRHGRLRDLKKVDYGAPHACRVCPLRPRCTNDIRSVSRLENEDVLDRMAERLRARPHILDRRREVVEHPFGSIKQWMYQGAFLMRGLENVRAEFNLTALVYNLRRALNVVGVEPMIAAVRG